MLLVPFDDVSLIQFSRYLLNLCVSFLLERMESQAGQRRDRSV